MFLVRFEKKCACLKRSEYQEEKMFQLEDDAVSFAQNLCFLLNEKLCQKHIFKYKKENNTILIQMDIRE